MDGTKVSATLHPAKKDCSTACTDYPALSMGDISRQHNCQHSSYCAVFPLSKTKTSSATAWIGVVAKPGWEVGARSTKRATRSPDSFQMPEVGPWIYFLNSIMKHMTLSNSKLSSSNSFNVPMRTSTIAEKANREPPKLSWIVPTTLIRRDVSSRITLIASIYE